LGNSFTTKIPLAEMQESKVVAWRHERGVSSSYVASIGGADVEQTVSIPTWHFNLVDTEFAV